MPSPQRQGIGGGADEDRAAVGLRVVDPVGDGAAIGLEAKVVVHDQFGAAVPVPQTTSRGWFRGVGQAATTKGSLCIEQLKWTCAPAVQPPLDPRGEFAPKTEDRSVNARANFPLVSRTFAAGRLAARGFHMSTSPGC